MPEDENDLKRINILNREKLRQAFEELPLLRTMRSQAARAGRNDILQLLSIDKLTDEYADSMDMNSVLNNIDFKPDETSLLEKVEAVRAEITEEKNGFVFTERGEYDAQASADQAIDEEYKRSPDYAREIMSREEVALGIENYDIIESLLSSRRSEPQKSVEMVLENLSKASRDFLLDIANGNEISVERKQELVQEFSASHGNISTELGRNGYIATVDELNFISLIYQFNNFKFSSLEAQKALLADIARLPEAQKYVDPETGKVSLSKAFEVEENWEIKYLSKKRAETFLEYDRKRGHKTWANMSQADKEEILKAAVQTLREGKSDEKLKLAAERIMMDIAPSDPPGIIVTVGPDGKAISTLNEEAVLKCYNSINSGTIEENPQHIYERWDKEDHESVWEKIQGLNEYYQEHGTLLTEEQYIDFQEQEKIMDQSLDGMINNLEQIEKAQQKAKIITSNPQLKLDVRLNSIISGFKTEDGKEELSHEEKIACVMAAYRTLKRSGSFGLGMDLSNPEINKEALRLLENHILEHPATYGNYIDEEPNGTKEIKYGNNRTRNGKGAYNSAKLDSMAKPGSPYYKYIETILAESKKTAREVIFKDVSLKDKILSRDGVETLAGMAKDGLKFLIKNGMKFVLGEDRAMETIKNVKATKAYQAVKNATYATAGAVYGSLKTVLGAPYQLIGKPLAKRFLPNSSRLALGTGGANEVLNVKIEDLLQIMKDEGQANFIETTEELEFTKLAVRFDRMNLQEKDIAIDKLAKMECAQKYKDPETGEVDVGQILQKGKDWEKRLVEKRRAQSFLKYNDTRNENKGFEDLSPEEQYNIIRSAACTVEDKDTDPRLRNMAIAVLRDISSTLIDVKQDRKTKEISFKVNTEDLLMIYNSIPGIDRYDRTDILMKALHHNEEGLASEKLYDLSKPGKLVSKTSWEIIQETRDAARYGKNARRKQAKQKALTEGKEDPKKVAEEQHEGNKTEVSSAIAPLGQEYTEKTNAVSSEMSQKMADATKTQESTEQGQKVAVAAQAPKKKPEGMEI